MYQKQTRLIVEDGARADDAEFRLEPVSALKVVIESREGGAIVTSASSDSVALIRTTP